MAAAVNNNGDPLIPRVINDGQPNSPTFGCIS